MTPFPVTQSPIVGTLRRKCFHSNRYLQAAAGTLTLLGILGVCSPADCRQADSKGQKPPATNSKPPQTPQTNPVPPKSALQPPVTNHQPPTTSHPPPLRLSLLGPLPAAIQQQTAHVAIDAGILGNALPTFWRGNARTPAFGLANTPSSIPPLPAAASALRKAEGAILTRLYPFATPGTLTLHPDGTPIVRWESVDAALRQAAQAGEDVIFNVQCPPRLSPDGWRALVEATLRRYHDNPPAPIARWEAALSAGEVETRYEPFARLARSLYPNTPIGLNFVAKEEAGKEDVKKNAAAGDVAEAMRRMAQICAQNKVPLDSVGWRVADTPALAAQQVERVRRVLAAFPALKNVFLLPTFGLAASNAASAETTSPQTISSQTLSPNLLSPFAFAARSSNTAFAPSRLLSFAAHLLETNASAPPNVLVGGLLEEPLPPLPSEMRRMANTSSTEAQPLAGEAQYTTGANPQTGLPNAQQALALLNRMAGTRLRAQSDDSGIGCLAARSQAHTLILLWREPSGNSSNRPTGHAARLSDNGNALIVAHLRHLGLENTLGLRIIQYDLAQTLADSSSLLPNGLAASSLVPTPLPLPANANGAGAAGSLTGAGTQSALPPSGTADTLWSGNAAPDEIEIPALLQPGSVCLLDIAPLKIKMPLACTLTTDAANLTGGEPFRVIMTVHNLSAAPQNLDILLASPFHDLLAQSGAQFKPGMLAANATRAFRFELRAPVLDSHANVTLTARVGASAAMLTVPVQAPLEASLESPRADVESGTGRANARVRLTNRSSVPLNIHLQAGENAGNKAASSAGTSVVVPPGRKPVMAILAVSPPAREPGLYPSFISVETATRRLQTLRPLLGVSLLCPYALTKPVLDGDLKEWAGNTLLGMGRAEQAGGKPWNGPADVSAYAYTQWDEQYFYFACAVTDDVFTPPMRADALTQGDCVLFALAITPRPGAQTARSPYAKFGMAILQNGQGASTPVLVRLRPAPIPGGRETSVHKETALPMKNAHLAVRREDTRTFYEAAIPWSELLPGPAAPDSIISLAILVNDVDGRAQGFMAWGSGLNGAINPLLFPPLRLVKSPPR